VDSLPPRWKKRYGAVHGSQQSWGDWSARRAFLFHREWNGKPYATKQVRTIIIDEANEIIVVTVYTYYSQKEMSP
jgi:hypothetical protein